MSKTFSHYTIEGKLGQGGMGEVFKARDSRLARDVALKFLTAEFANDAERLARFEREARLLASLSHPNIAAIHGLEEDGGRRALVLEYVAGDDLSVPIKKGPIAHDDVLDIARQLAEALDAAHEQGVVHRDLKPANIKLMRDGTVKVLDFGLAKALDTGPPGGSTDPSITQSPTLMGTAQGVILGTAAYMSPEQARGKPVDKRADIWAFGCVVFEMLTGSHTFTGETISDTLAAILRADPEWDKIPADTHPAVVTLLQRCLEKDPRRRLRDVGEAHIIIEAVQSGTASVTGIHASGVTTASGSWQPGAHGATAGSTTPGSTPDAMGHPGMTGGKPPKKRGIFKRILFGTLRVIHWIFTLGFMAAWITFMVLYLVESNKPGEKLPVIRALVTPEEGRTFSNASFQNFAFHAISPNGKMITFHSDNFLWVRSLDQVNATQIPGTEGVSFPFWSADSRSIGFFADGKLKTVRAGGGPINVVCDASQGRGGAWNHDDVIVFTPSLRTGLHRVPASGGTPVQFTQPNRPTHSTHRWPRFLPDGEHILYMAANHTNPKGAQTAIYVTSLTEGKETHLIAADSHPVYASGYLLYTRDRNLMAHPFSRSRLALYGEPIRIAENCNHHGGSWVGVFDARGDVLIYQGDAPPIGSVLTWMDKDGNAQGVIGRRDLNWDTAISPSSKQIVIARGNPEPSLYLTDVEGGVEQRITIDGSFSRAPVWSPGGMRIAYASIRENERLNVYVVPADRSAQPKPLVVDDVDMIPTSWSPDGRHLLVDYGDPGETEIWVLSTDDDADPVPVVQTRPWVYEGRFSPDGKWIAYVSREEGDDAVFVTAYPGPGGKARVSNLLGTGPQWSADMQHLYFHSRAVMESAFRVEGGRMRFEPAEILFRFSRDASFFVQSGSDFSRSEDGRFLCKLANEEPNDITALTLVIGWASELEER
jgi:Tol biopolymer transport system component